MWFINSCALLLLLLPFLLPLQQPLQQRARRGIVRHIYGERRFSASPWLQRSIFQEWCVYVDVLPEGVTPFLRCSAPLYNVFTRVFFFARVPPANCQNFAASRTNTGTCAAAATLTFTATTSRSSSSSSLVSREAIKSSTKETNTLFFFPAPAYSFSCSSSSKTLVTSLRTFPPFAHNFDTVLTEEKKPLLSSSTSIFRLDGSPFLLVRLVNYFFLFPSPIPAPSQCTVVVRCLSFP